MMVIAAMKLKDAYSLEEKLWAMMLCDASGPRLGGKASAAEDFAEDDDDPLA